MRIIQGELIYKGSNYRGVVGGLETMRDIEDPQLADPMQQNPQQ